MSFRSYRTPKGNLRVKRVHTIGAFTGGRSIAKPCFASLNVDVVTPSDVASYQQRAEERKKARKAADKAKALDYLKSSHEFQLWRGETAFGKPKVMTGREVRDLNRDFERKFMDSKDPNARLWAWRRVGIKPMPRGTTEEQRRQYLFDRSVRA